MLKRLLNYVNKDQIHIKSFLQNRWATGNTSGGKEIVILEDDLAVSLKAQFPKASYIEVNDVSGGCGAMFEVTIEAPDFKGLPIVKQHRLVTTALKDHIKGMHGIRIQTSVTKE